MLSNILPNALQYLLASYVLPATHWQTQSHSMRFELRHAHGMAANSSRIVFADMTQAQRLATDGLQVQTRPTRISRARSQNEFFNARSRGSTQLELLWDEVEVEGPDVRSRETLHMLAKMTNNAYYDDRGKKGWYDIGPEWNSVRRAYL